MSNNDSDSDYEYFSLSSAHGSTSEDSFHSSPPSLSETLCTTFEDCPKYFNAVHINAQSIPAHYPDMLAAFDVRDLHAILVSESWLKPCLPSTSYSLPGFHLIRNDRSVRTGGGVAIYLRSHIPYSIVSMSTTINPMHELEYLLIEITLSHSKVLLGVFYSPSLTINYFPVLEKLIEDFSHIYSHTIFMGDFNTCLLKNDHRSSSLLSIINSNNLHLPPLSATHHYPNSLPSLLDIMVVSSFDHVAKHGQYSANDFSFHDLLYLSYKIRTPKMKPKVLLLRNFNKLDTDALRADAAEADWNAVFHEHNIDNKINLFNKLLTQLYDRHAPLRPVRLRHLPAPWLTENLKALLHKKVLAKSKYKSNNSDRNLNNYKQIRNQCNRACRDAQRRYIHKSVENGNPSKTWKFLRTLGIGKNRNITGNTQNINLNLICQHFSASVAMSDTVRSSTICNISNTPRHDCPLFSFIDFTIFLIRPSPQVTSLLNGN